MNMNKPVSYIDLWSGEMQVSEASAEQAAWREIWDQILSGLVWLS